MGNNRRQSSAKPGWSWCWVSAVDCDGRTIWIANAHRTDGKHFITRADQNGIAFVKWNQRFQVDTTGSGHIGLSREL
jgi:hypothetical protein